MIEIYAKRQRAKRKDPQQEAIVTEKDKINERTTKLIALMKAMKSGWNGGPSPDIGVEKYNLTQPIPDVVVGSGDAALHELSEIVQTLRQIKSMQDTYSEARTQRIEKMRQVQPAAPPAAPAPNENQQQQIAAAVREELLKKTASNPFSRVWTHVIAYNPFVSEKNRGQRLALLRSLARINDNLKDVEDNVLSMGEASLLDAIYVARQLYIDAKSSFFGTFRRNVNQILEDTNKQLEDLKKNVGKTDGDKIEPGDPGKGIGHDIVSKVNEIQAVIAEPIEVPKVDVAEPERAPVGVDMDILPPKSDETSTQVPEIKQEPQPTIVTEPKSTEPKSETRRRRRRKTPTVPVAQEKSVLVDPEYEAEQQAIATRYQAAAEYVYGNVNSLQSECESIIVQNFQGVWREQINKVYSVIYSLGNNISMQLENGEDYESNYVKFLQAVGYLKSINYVATVEQMSQKNDPELETGDMFNEAELKVQADRFAEFEYSKYYDSVSKKISQATSASRFIKRMLTYMIPRKDKNLRLMISRHARNARQALQGMMDTLEDRHLNFRRLAFTSETFFDSLRAVYEGLADIAEMYNSSMRIEKSHRKQQNVKMTYDLIPTMDINALRMMQSYLEHDVINLQKLQDVEDSILKMSRGNDE